MIPSFGYGGDSLPATFGYGTGEVVALVPGQVYLSDRAPSVTLSDRAPSVTLSDRLANE